MDDPAASLENALQLLTEIGNSVTAHDALDELDDATLQVFWREWPRVSSWGGTLWRLLNADIGGSARPVADAEFGELGGSG